VKRYVYIVCYYHGEDPAFVHTFVRTNEGEDTAYALGGVWADRELKEFKGKLINDYVVALE
jgi:hypothetical protein